MAFQVKTPGLPSAAICTVEKSGRLWKAPESDPLEWRQASDATGVVENLQERAAKKEINRLGKKIYESCSENGAGTPTSARILAHDEIVPRGTIWADEIGNLEAEGQFGPEDWFRLGGLSLKIVPRGTILGRR